MFLRNSREQGFVNGSMGTVTKLSEDEIEVRIEDEWGGSEVAIETSEWESNKYKFDPDTWHSADVERLRAYRYESRYAREISSLTLLWKRFLQK